MVDSLKNRDPEENTIPYIISRSWATVVQAHRHETKFS